MDDGFEARMRERKAREEAEEAKAREEAGVRRAPLHLVPDAERAVEAVEAERQPWPPPVAARQAALSFFQKGGRIHIHGMVLEVVAVSAHPCRVVLNPVGWTKERP